VRVSPLRGSHQQIRKPSRNSRKPNRARRNGPTPAMTRWAAALLTFASVGAAGCGGDDVGAQRRERRRSRRLGHVTTWLLRRSRGGPRRGYSRSRSWPFRRCRRPGEAEISYTARARSATQLVTTENLGLSSNGRLDPGQRMAVAIGRRIGPRVDWQVALLSEGSVEGATASFTTGKLSGRSGCFATGKAQVTERRR
jgi:hypothetical protein